MISRIAMILGAAALAAACTLDRSPPPSGIPAPAAASGFVAVDRDADGQVTRAEWEAHASDIFAALDRDASGFLEGVEFTDGFAAFDANGDGVLTPEEVEALEIDADGDGQITESEWRASEIAARYDSDGDGQVSAAEFRKRRTSAFERYDGNLDRIVTKTEIDPSNQRFAVFRF